MFQKKYVILGGGILGLLIADAYLQAGIPGNQLNLISDNTGASHSTLGNLRFASSCEGDLFKLPSFKFLDTHTQQWIQHYNQQWSTNKKAQLKDIQTQGLNTALHFFQTRYPDLILPTDLAKLYYNNSSFSPLEKMTGFAFQLLPFIQRITADLQQKGVHIRNTDSVQHIERDTQNRILSIQVNDQQEIYDHYTLAMGSTTDFLPQSMKTRILPVMGLWTQLKSSQTDFEPNTPKPNARSALKIIEHPLLKPAHATTPFWNLTRNEDDLLIGTGILPLPLKAHPLKSFSLTRSPAESLSSFPEYTAEFAAITRRLLSLLSGSNNDILQQSTCIRNCSDNGLPIINTHKNSIAIAGTGSGGICMSFYTAKNTQIAHLLNQ